METFGKPREFVEDDGYICARQRAISSLNFDEVDRPIRDIVHGFARLPHCFTLQCCYGHFICDERQDYDSLKAIPAGYAGTVRYRIAYIAFCLENSKPGRKLRESLAAVAAIDPEFIQFGSAGWFWEQWPNSFALQVEPSVSLCEDEVLLASGEARYIQGLRDRFFVALRILLQKELEHYGKGGQS